MPTERLSMRKTREILRQKWVLDRSHREVATSVGLSVGAVAGTQKRAAEAQLDRRGAEAHVAQLVHERMRSRVEVVVDLDVPPRGGYVRAPTSGAVSLVSFAWTVAPRASPLLVADVLRCLPSVAFATAPPGPSSTRSGGCSR